MRVDVPMADRSADWLKQAEADLRHAQHARDVGDYEWAAFAAHAAAEKAIKAVLLHRGVESWGRVLSGLLLQIPSADDAESADDTLLDRARELDKHFILARYPDGYESGAPTDFYTRGEAERAIEHAAAILDFCRDKVQR